MLLLRFVLGITHQQGAAFILSWKSAATVLYTTFLLRTAVNDHYHTWHEEAHKFSISYFIDLILSSPLLAQEDMRHSAEADA